MAKAAISTTVGRIVDYLVPQALENVGKLWGVKREIEGLRDTISTLPAVSDHAEEQYYQSPRVREWVNKLKDAIYDAEDVLEEFNFEAMRRKLQGHSEMIKEVRTFFSSSNQIAFQLKMSYKVRGVRERMQAIKADRGFHLDERRVDSQIEREGENREETQREGENREETQREGEHREETHSFMREGDIIGRDDDKNAVMNFLLDSDMQENISILPIVGLGGLGKTALARCVYNDDMVSKHFHLKMWACVSSDFDVKKIVKDMIACAKKEEPTVVVMNWLQSELRREIDGKRYFLVLDDLWNIEQEIWLSLKTLLVGGARGSKILITTRLPVVAEITGTTRPHFLGGLTESASLYLLLRMAWVKKEEIPPAMLAIGKMIALKCSGIPLVVRIVGSLLVGKETHEWAYFLKRELQQVVQNEQSIFPVLRLSYDHLPSPVKQCFAFCSLFPEDYEIPKQTLINLWVAEGFIQPSPERTLSLEDIAHEYFMDLLLGNFFHDFQKDSVTNKEICKMPDLMRDLACSVAGSEYRKVGDHERAVRDSRYLSYGSISDLISLLAPSSIRTILSVRTYREMEGRKPIGEVDLRHLIQSFRRLRVFDLHAAIVKKVPRSICKLKHLTYLDLSHNNELKRLPNSITRLHNLQTLNLQGCSALEELPRDIRKLVNLRNLDIDHCHSLSYVPRGLEQLTSLHSLTRFILPKDKALGKNYCRLGELSRLNDLRGSLSIENLGHSEDELKESKAAKLIEKRSLESLILRWRYLDVDDAEIKDEALLDALRPHSNLQMLTIEGYEGKGLPNWIMDSLVEVHLLRCGRIEDLSRLGQLPQLKSLELWGITELQSFDQQMEKELESIKSDHSPTSTTLFPSLLKLEIRHCEHLKALPKWLQSLTSLEHLGISECPQLTSLSGGMQHLSNLVDLSISNCEELDLSKDERGNILDLRGLEKLRFVDILGVPKLASLPRWLLRVHNLEHLSIKKCLNLKALPEQIGDLQSLQKLEIIRCPSLTSLPEGMQRLSSLTHLKIAGCPESEKRCKEDAGEDWKNIPLKAKLSHELDFNDRHL